MMAKKIFIPTLCLCGVTLFSLSSVLAEEENSLTEAKENIEVKENIAADDQGNKKQEGMKNTSSTKNTKTEEDRFASGEYKPGYNAPAAIDVTHKLYGWGCNLYVDAAFTFWRADQEGMDLATGLAQTMTTDLSVVTVFTDHGKMLRQKFVYKPGFKAGFGVESGDWSVDFNYTWVRQETKVNKSPPKQDPSLGLPIWSINNWFLQDSSSLQNLAGTHIKSKWHLAMDIADGVFQRPFYVGRYMTLMPYGGIRAAWIRQKMKVGLTEAPGTRPSLPPQPIFSRNTSNSWGIGPRVGTQGAWLLPWNFKARGNIAASLLYTEYRTLKHSEDAASTIIIPSEFRLSENGFKTVRPILEIGLGIGWGDYICNKRFHLDFSADYDFAVYWQQNMMRKLLDSALSNSGACPSELNLQGFTLTARFDF